jgi:hypothetical protein
MKVLGLGLVAISLCAISSIAACSGSSDQSPTADNTPPPGDDGTNPTPPNAPSDAGATVFPAAHPAAPQVQSLGGPVFANPIFIQVFFPGTSFNSQLKDFASKVGSNPYWKAIGEEYGVGPATVQTAIEVADAPPATMRDADIKAWLASRFDGTHPEFGTEPVLGAIYTLYYPSSTTISLGGGGGGDGGARDGGAGRGGGSCKSFGGYHDSATLGTHSIAYAVIPECTTFGGLTGMDVVTGTSSHEWIEAATDPFPTTQPAYAQPDDDHIAWEFALGGGEVGDMCAQDMDAFYRDPSLGYIVQRSWSNAAAAKGQNPCVPASTKPYFNSVPVLTDDINVGGGTTKGVKVPVGSSKTIDVDLFSTAATSGAWKVEVITTSQTAPVTFQLDKSTGKNGDKLKLTIQSTAASTSRLGGTAFLVTSTLGNDIRFWAGMVGN